MPLVLQPLPTPYRSDKRPLKNAGTWWWYLTRPSTAALFHGAEACRYLNDMGAATAVTQVAFPALLQSGYLYYPSVVGNEAIDLFFNV